MGPASTVQAPPTIALLGAERTGKTTLAHALAAALAARGHTVALVPDGLRAWCTDASRAPRAPEYVAIAQAETARIAAARRSVADRPRPVVVADTSALSVAVYADLLFADRALYPEALRRQPAGATTLVMGIDLPWVDGGLQREDPHVQGPFDARLRAVLAGAGEPFRVVYGRGAQRVANALRALAPVLDNAAAPAAVPHAVWQCEACSDAACEHQLFTRLLQPPPQLLPKT